MAPVMLLGFRLVVVVVVVGLVVVVFHRLTDVFSVLAVSTNITCD